MTPQEKASDLIEKFSEYSHTDFNPIKGGYQVKSQIANAKKCALIAVNEIVKEIQCNEVEFQLNVPLSVYTYWKNVKEEIDTI